MRREDQYTPVETPGTEEWKKLREQQRANKEKRRRCHSRSWEGAEAARCTRQAGHDGKHRGSAEHYGACEWK